MKKKLVTLFLALMATCCLFGFAACDGAGSGGNNPNDDTPVHKHSYVIANHDDNEHWEECSCGEKQNITAHSFDTPNKDDNEHWNECVCGARENSTPHAFTVEGFDGKNHYTACSCGQIQESTAEAHNFDENGDCTGCEATQGTKGVEYTLSHDKSYYTCSGIGTATETDMVIANVYNGLLVTTIRNNAFDRCTSLTSITIPDSVTTIGEFAFRGCSGLTSVTIGNGVTTIGGYAFPGCSGLTSVTIPDGVTTIGGSAFENCSNLTSVTIPDSVTTIVNSAFYGCDKLIQKENGVSYVDKWVIDCDASVTEVELRANTKGIADYAFGLCSGLTSITVDENNQNYQSIDGNLYTKDGKTLIQYAIGKVATEFIIPDGVTTIGRMAFTYCSKLTSVTIPDSVTTIGAYAFQYCSNLTSVTIGNGVTMIGDYAFVGCSNLTSVYITDIAKWCAIDFGGDYSNSVIYDNYSNPLSYANNLYVNNELVTELVIPDGVTTIGGYAFPGWSGLTSVTIPDSVTTIGEKAFYGCGELTSVCITDIAKWCAIDFGGYYNNPLSYAKYLYVNNELVTELVIPDGVTTIGNYAFYNCSGLTSVTIPDGVTTIGNYAFYNCSGLTSVTIPDSVTTIGEYAFRDCSSLTSITVDKNNQNYQSIDGNLYTKDGKTLIQYARGKTATEFIIPDGVTTIGENAFRGCSKLTSVTIPDSVTTIGDSAFDYCYKLIEVVNKSGLSMEAGSSGNGYVAYYAKQVITDEKDSNLIYEGDYIFYNDDETYYLVTYAGTQTELTLPENCKGNDYHIYEDAFYDCDNLISVTIPDSVTTIGGYAFRDCSNLTSVTIGNGVTTIVNSAFYGCDKLIQKENGVSYVDKWVVDFDASVTAVELRADTKGIADGAFSSCSKLTSVTIPDGVTTIGKHAFLGCSGLTSVTIGNGVTTIGEWAFNGCRKLTSLTIGDGVTTIGDAAFFQCSDLTSVYYHGTESEWKEVTFGGSNGNLTSATRYYYSESAPTASGNYWRYVDGVPTPWATV